ncbi:MAG: hypothetical protein NVS9B7_08930 [Flavisolibacter sp.]
MVSFSKRIETEWGKFNFYFNEIYTMEGRRFHISLIGRDMKALMFHMKANESKWEFVNSSNCPEWLTKLEKELSNLIKESLK